VRDKDICTDRKYHDEDVTTMAMHLDLRSFSLLILTQLKNEFS